MYKQQGDPWNLQIPNTAVLRHSLIYTGMSFSSKGEGKADRTLISHVMLMVYLSKLGLESQYSTRSETCCVRVVPKPTQPPDSKAGPRGSLRS